MTEQIKANSEELIEKILDNIEIFLESEDPIEQKYDNYTVFVSFNEEDSYIEFDYELTDKTKFDVDLEYVMEGVFAQISDETEE
ncbi:MAG: hypothetical protein H6Q15_552 [Bacteroidetes bacterium]|nr:hypothetical protein [Bacteroidota bacterium]